MQCIFSSRRLASCFSVLIGLTVFLLGSSAHAQAGSVPTDAARGTQTAEQPIEEVIVFGRNADLLGQADSASEGFIGGADLLIRPLVRTAELLESMPGMVAVQHSGSGKANQYFLRGFNLDHGTDYSVYVDGTPLNMKSHGHGQGYLDVNGLIPETVERIDYRKGPYHADLGDFSMAGVSSIRTIDRLDQPFISVQLGENAWQRYVGGMSGEIGEGTLTVIGERKHHDGPWQHEEDLKHMSVWAKYLVDSEIGRLAVTLSGYDADWKPTEQIPERAVGTSVCRNSFCSLDPTATGNTKRWILSSQILADNWSGSIYAQYYDWEMTSNPTYDFQINQFDRRWSVGGRANYTALDSAKLNIEVGGDFQIDDIRDVGLDQFSAGEFVSRIGDNEIEQESVGFYLDSTWFVTDKLRVLTGLRHDYYDFDATARTATSFSGHKNDTRTSPKLGAAFAANESVELYASWGKGFHSNDARGVVNQSSPVPGLSPGTGYEFGVRSALGSLKLTASYWWLDQDSELIFLGDSNSVEPMGGSEREGLELTLFWQPLDWLAIDSVLTNSRARFTDNDEGSHIEGAVEESGQLGITLKRPTWDASIRLRYLGPYALVADNSERAGSLTTVNLRGARHWDSLTVFAEVINLFDSDGKEIVYHYPAFVAGLDPSGLSSESIDCDLVNCRMSRVTEPQAIRVGLNYKF